MEPLQIDFNVTPATKHQYTGQYSNMSDFGLMFYNARWYDPTLGRFAQADTIIPGGVQGLDRYAYVNNSPINYIDPSGHESVCTGSNADPECNGGHDNWVPPSGATYWRVQTQIRFGITLSNDGGKDWDEANAKLVYNSLVNINDGLNGKLKSLTGGATFELAEYVATEANCPDGGCQYQGWTNGTTITFETIGNAAIRQMNIYHEFGHLIDNSPGMVNVFSGALDGLDSPNYILAGGENVGEIDSSALVSSSVYDPNYGTAQALQHPSTDPIEQWADIFANYVVGNINVASPQGLNMYNFITGALAPYITP